MTTTAQISLNWPINAALDALATRDTVHAAADPISLRLHSDPLFAEADELVFMHPSKATSGECPLILKSNQRVPSPAKPLALQTDVRPKLETQLQLL